MQMLGFIKERLLFTYFVRNQLEYNFHLEPFRQRSCKFYGNKFPRTINLKLGIPSDDIYYDSQLQLLRLLSLKAKRTCTELFIYNRRKLV